MVKELEKIMMRRLSRRNRITGSSAETAKKVYAIMKSIKNAHNANNIFNSYDIIQSTVNDITEIGNSLYQDDICEKCDNEITVEINTSYSLLTLAISYFINHKLISKNKIELPAIESLEDAFEEMAAGVRIAKCDNCGHVEHAIAYFP